MPRCPLMILQRILPQKLPIALIAYECMSRRCMLFDGIRTPKQPITVPTVTMVLRSLMFLQRFWLNECSVASAANEVVKGLAVLLRCVWVREELLTFPAVAVAFRLLVGMQSTDTSESTVARTTRHGLLVQYFARYAQESLWVKKSLLYSSDTV